MLSPMWSGPNCVSLTPGTRVRCTCGALPPKSSTISDRGRMPAAALTYGEERKVGIARAISTASLMLSAWRIR